MVSSADITLVKNAWTDLTAVTGAGTGVKLRVSNVTSGGGITCRIETATVEPPTGPIKNGILVRQGGTVDASPVAGDSVFATSEIGGAKVSVQVLP